MTLEADSYTYPGTRYTKDGTPVGHGQGMTMRDYFAGQALHNPELCPGVASDYDLKAMFGPDRNSITRSEIAAKQAYRIADAMIAART